jgi:hypothetical protein
VRDAAQRWTQSLPSSGASCGGSVGYSIEAPALVGGDVWYTGVDIRRLEADGLLAAAGDDERRIFYGLTPFGRRVLAAEMRRLRELVGLAEARGILAPARA